MASLKDVKIATRLKGGFATVLVLMIALTAIGVSKVNEINSNLATINDVNSVKQRYALNFRGSVHDRAIALRDVVLLSERAEIQGELDLIADLEAFYQEAEVAMDRMFADRADIKAKERDLLAAIKDIEAHTMPLAAEVVDLRLAGRDAEALDVLIADARPGFVEWLARINAFIDYQEAQNSVVADRTRAVADGFQLLMVALCAVALAFGVALAWWSIASVRPLSRLTAATKTLADGELSVEIPASNSRDEVGLLLSAVQVFKDNMVRNRELEEKAEAERAQAEAERTKAADERRKTLEDLASRFEQSIGTLVASASESARSI